MPEICAPDTHTRARHVKALQRLQNFHKCLVILRLLSVFSCFPPFFQAALRSAGISSLRAGGTLKERVRPSTSSDRAATPKNYSDINWNSNRAFNWRPCFQQQHNAFFSKQQAAFAAFVDHMLRAAVAALDSPFGQKEKRRRRRPRRRRCVPSPLLLLY